MVEGAPLLREYTGNGIEGSNPFFSAIFGFAMALVVHDCSHFYAPFLPLAGAASGLNEAMRR